MLIEEYFQNLIEGNLEKAEQLRQSTIPNKLINFVNLYDTKTKDSKINKENKERNDNKYNTLREKSIYFSRVNRVNDPYEFKGIILDEEKLKKVSSPELIRLLNSILEFEDYGIACLSANPPDFLPMWAYYANSSKGFCVEYDVIKKDCIHEVLYEPKRIKVASLILEAYKSAKRAMITGNDKELIIYEKMLSQELFIKSDSWAHEKECRIVYSITKEKGENIPVNNIGLKIHRIIAGINCAEEDINTLNQISNEIGIGDVYKSKIHPSDYTIQIYR